GVYRGVVPLLPVEDGLGVLGLLLRRTPSSVLLAEKLPGHVELPVRDVAAHLESLAVGFRDAWMGGFVRRQTALLVLLAAAARAGIVPADLTPLYRRACRLRG